MLAWYQKLCLCADHLGEHFVKTLVEKRIFHEAGDVVLYNRGTNRRISTENNHRNGVIDFAYPRQCIVRV